MLEKICINKRMPAVCMGVLLISLFAIVPGCSPDTPRRPVDYVNALIGTAPLPDKKYLGNNPAPGEELYYGCVNPGAMVPNPNGKVCAGPVSGFDGQRYHVRGSGYRYTDQTIMGFTNMNGEYHDDNKILFMPTIGAIKTIPGTRENPFEGYRSAKDTLQEKATPGYYTVFLTTYGIKVELTATESCGFQRYTFPESKEANVLLDLANSQPWAKHAAVTIVDQHTIKGVQEYTVDTVFHIAGGERIFFYAVFNKDFKVSGTWKNDVLSPGSAAADGMPLGAYATFETSKGEKILVKVGISTVSEEDAAQKLEKEIPGMDFDAIHQQTEQLWSNVLDKVVVEGGTEAEKINFYTAVYRKNGYGRGGILPQFENTAGAKVRNMRGSWGGGYWGPGAVGGVVGNYKSGVRNIDINAAYEKFKNDAMTGGGAAGDAYRKFGYIPSGVGVDDYVNRSLGLSYEDYAMAELAKIVGNDADYKFFMERSMGYKKLFNPSTGFFTPRNIDGSWILPLNPYNFHAEDIYREGNAWNYLWFNVGDIPGLVNLLGGKDKFISKLDTFFTTPLPADATPLRDCTGLVGLYCHGNEQYRHIPYLYNYVGQPWRTQEIVRKIQLELYRAVPAGMCGMDDYGNLEGWYSTSVLGFNTADRASGYYEIGSPLFPKAIVTLEGGIFTIEAYNVSDINMYVQSATLNGKALNISRFRQDEIVPGGSLVFVMGPKPNINWGVETPSEK
ncbi:MAG TPA: GH92 family glycosyl hydrolase [Prolixibacteraceae bacterium]|nr:GH92 family glycosyl hydrolase [Prolixibacteraceae bacterium]